MTWQSDSMPEQYEWVEEKRKRGGSIFTWEGKAITITLLNNHLHAPDTWACYVKPFTDGGSPRFMESVSEMTEEEAKTTAFFIARGYLEAMHYDYEKVVEELVR